MSTVSTKKQKLWTRSSVWVLSPAGSGVDLFSGSVHVSSRRSETGRRKLALKGRTVWSFFTQQLLLLERVDVTENHS